MRLKLKKGEVAHIGDSDYHLVERYVWYYLPTSGYIATSISYSKTKVKTVFLHRLIMDAPTGRYVDHIDGDKLNNRRSNLRICGNTENQWNSGISKCNTSGYKGVSYDKVNKKWFASIRIDKKAKLLGRFKTPELAAVAYNEAALLHRGEYAKLNNIGV